MKAELDDDFNLILTPDNNIEVLALRVWSKEFFDNVTNYSSKSLSKVDIKISTGIISQTNVIINLQLDNNKKENK